MLEIRFCLLDFAVGCCVTKGVVLVGVGVPILEIRFCLLDLQLGAV